MIIKVNFNVSLQCANCGVRLSFAENTNTDKYDSILEVEPHVCNVLTQRAADEVPAWLCECGRKHIKVHYGFTCLCGAVLRR